MSVIGLKKANCKNCYKCLKVCPVKSIRVVNEQAQIIDRTTACCAAPVWPTARKTPKPLPAAWIR